MIDKKNEKYQTFDKTPHKIIYSILTTTLPKTFLSSKVFIALAESSRA
jgi:hypothetical protein